MTPKKRLYPLNGSGKGFYNRGEKPLEIMKKKPPRPTKKNNRKIGGSEPNARAIGVGAEYCLSLFDKECCVDRPPKFQISLMAPSCRNSPQGESSQLYGWCKVRSSLL